MYQIPTIVPFSEIGEPPESNAITWRKSIGVLFAGIMTLVTTAVLIAILPLVTILTIIRRIIYSRKIILKDPGQIKIGIIGGGWSGIQCMARLKELGVDVEKNVKGFEAHTSFGGTWHPALRYHNIQIHGAMWVSSFSNYPYDKHDRDNTDGKVSGEEMERYVNRFANDEKSHSSYEFNTRVKKVMYDTKKRKATLILQDSRSGPTFLNERKSGPFDLVIYCSLASEPKIPKMLGQDSFQGKIIHTLNFKKEDCEDIISNNRKVVIVGGSKAGCDMVLCLHREGYKNFEWVMPKPYIFWKYEVLCHDRSLKNTLRGWSTIVAALWSLLSKNISGLIMWGSGLAVTYGIPHNDWNKFTFGLLCPTQRQDLAAVPKEVQIIGRATRYISSGIELESGQKVDADVIIWATGCETGIDKLQYEKDGEYYNLNKCAKMLNHFLYPDFPVFANGSALFTTFGPVRAVNAADLAVYHCCIREKLEEDKLIRMASWQLGGSVNSVSSLIFQNKSYAVKEFVTTHIDLMLVGLVDFFDFMWHITELFTLSRQHALKFRIFPRNFKGMHNNGEIKPAAVETGAPLIPTFDNDAKQEFER